jgi:hypothetical protein
MPNPTAMSVSLMENTPIEPTQGDHCEACDDVGCGGVYPVPDPTMIVERWHNETHPNGFRFCDQQPCHAINWAAR